MTTALIDADVLVYQCAFAFQRKGEDVGLFDEVITCLDNLILGMLEETGADNYRLFLTGKGNFRYNVAKTVPYKGNRKSEKPFHYENIRIYMQSVYNAEVITGMEADDALAINQTEDTVICTIDKDLLQVPGKHYNWRKNEHYVIDEYDGWYNFYIQLLQGDRADNIKGIDGIGPTKAERILEGSEDPEDMFERVKAAYMANMPDDWYYRMSESAMLLWMVRELAEDGSPLAWRWPDAS